MILGLVVTAGAVAWFFAASGSNAGVDGDDSATQQPAVEVSPQSPAARSEVDAGSEPSEPPTPSAKVREQLDALTIVSGVAAAEYDRAFFGQAWFDEDRNGCDTRNDVLKRDLQHVVTKTGTGECKVLSGTLEDWYSGTTVSFVSGEDSSRLVQIDHIVPLSWAWKHGADQWTDEKRRAFANDPQNLVATTDKMNQSKSDSGPSTWLPENNLAQCRYAQAFTGVLSGYGLGIDLKDRAMLRGVLDECDSSQLFGSFAPSARSETQ